jgi:hypothetical protein
VLGKVLEVKVQFSYKDYFFLGNVINYILKKIKFFYILNYYFLFLLILKIKFKKYILIYF